MVRSAAIGITGQQRRDFHRDPAIEVMAGVKYRAEQIRGTAKILQCQFDEQAFTGLPRSRLLANAGVIRLAAADRAVEDGWIRGRPGDRQLLDVAAEGALIEQLAREVVQPEALTEVVQFSSRCDG